jgi:hypothetical protein
VKVALMTETTHNPFNEAHRVSCLRENLTSSSDGEGLETGCALSSVPRQSFTRKRGFAWINNCRRLDRFLEESQKTYRAFMRVFFIKHYLDRLF